MATGSQLRIRISSTYLLLITLFPFILIAQIKPVRSQSFLNGSFQNYNAFQTTGDNLLIAGRNRLRVQADQGLDDGNIHIKGDLFHHYLNYENEFELLLREAYADIYFNNSDLRAGKQIITLGRSVTSFVTDILTPLDLREFLTREIPDLREGLTALNYTRYFGNHYIQIIVSPAFQPNRLPDSNSRWFPEPPLPAFLSLNYAIQESKEGLRNLNAAARFAWRGQMKLDVDLMLYFWPHPMPAYGINVNTEPDITASSVNLTESYISSPMAGYSVAYRPAGRWEIHFESLFVQRRFFTYLPVPVNLLEDALEDPLLALQLLPEFIPGTDTDSFLMEKPWIHSMIGARFNTGGWTFTAQAFIEHIFSYKEEILAQEFFPYINGLIQKSFFRDRFNTLLLSQYNFYGEDFWLQTQGMYQWSDNFEISTGVNLFGGPDITPFYGHFTFSRYRPNSFMFFKLTAYF